MPRMSSTLHWPSRLGAPQDVRGAFHLGSFTSAAVVSAGIERSLFGVAPGPSPMRPPSCAEARDVPNAANKTSGMFFASIGEAPAGASGWLTLARLGPSSQRRTPCRATNGRAIAKQNMSRDRSAALDLRDELESPRCLVTTLRRAVSSPAA